MILQIRTVLCHCGPSLPEFCQPSCAQVPSSLVCFGLPLSLTSSWRDSGGVFCPKNWRSPMHLLRISLSIWSTGPAVRMRLNCAVHAHAAVDLQDTQWKAERTLWAGLALARLLCVAAILGAVMAIDHADPTGVNLARPCRHACKCAPYASTRKTGY